MVRSNGKRANTRHLFQKSFRKKGAEHTSTYLQVFKVGDYVDIRINSAVLKGMPHKFYQGRTGRVFNVSRTSVGVEVSKTIGNRVIMKRFHVRIEHVKKSRCQEDFHARVIANQEARAMAAKYKTKYVPFKRLPAQPAPAHVVDASIMELVEPVPYEFIV